MNPTGVGETALSQKGQPGLEQITEFQASFADVPELHHFSCPASSSGD